MAKAMNRDRIHRESVIQRDREPQRDRERNQNPERRTEHKE